jgi:NADH:ubiquinone oxidoreductase subunit 5 (subunit L)/multisubunit Na+/H+ antiporter MnhA subunit
MSQILQIFILLPLVAFVSSMFLPQKKEKAIALLSIAAITVYLLSCLSFIAYWIATGAPILDIKHIVIYRSHSFEFFIDFYFDTITAVYALVGSLILLLVTIFSRYYLHRDEGFKRFFNTLLLFFTGYNLVIFSGNFETLFIGWEILGFCSFLLIAFYRDRYLPVKNAMKVISVYRLGDVCLMLAMWMCHHLFHENITFIKLSEEFLAQHISEHRSLLIFTATMIVIAAAAKSAALPFSSWLPRAMEGPTTSSAVFYGSLSLHLGAFLLIRSYPLWQHLPEIKVLVIVLGATTSIVATSIARVQSTVKTQIGYSSITQIGLIFIEIALGFHILALVHFAGNAFLRTYQLLVSPSVLSYEIHDMVFNFKARPAVQNSGSFTQKLKNTIYMLSIKEWNLDAILYRNLWQPFKWIGKRFQLLNVKIAIILVSVLFLCGSGYLIMRDGIPGGADQAATMLFSIAGLVLVLSAFASRTNAKTAWLLIIAAQCSVTLSIAINDQLEAHEVLIYTSGIIVAAITGYLCLRNIEQIDDDISLNRFHSYAYEKPGIAFIFLLCCLASLGFPFTPTFLGIDLLFTHIHQDQFILIIVTSLSFIFIELAILRIYARIFLGQHKKNYHPIAYRSS